VTTSGAAAARERVLVTVRAMDAAGGPLPLRDLAAAAHCSERQLTRAFTAVLGVSPREYGEAVRTGVARTLLRDSMTVSDAAYGAGYGSSRAFYEETGRRLGMAPRAYAGGGSGRQLWWSARRARVGGLQRWVLAVASAEGLCWVSLGDRQRDLLEGARAEFPRARLDRDDEGLAGIMDALELIAAGASGGPEIPLDVRGTAFQARVWQALVRIPAGDTRTYAEVAAEIGEPTAVRAVARACATNPVALVVPCHRVVRADGSPSGYRWGLELKGALLAAEGRARPASATMEG